MIRIIKGTFGWFDGRRVRPVTAADGPQDLGPDLEARLVAEGVAEYAGRGGDAPQAGQDLDGLTRAELEAKAKELGIPIGKKNKAELADAIEAADEPPSLSAAEVE